MVVCPVWICLDRLFGGFFRHKQHLLIFEKTGVFLLNLLIYRRLKQKIFKLYFTTYIMFWIFKKKGVDEIKEETKKGFEAVKKDINAVSGWIKHLDSERNLHDKDIKELKDTLSSMQSEIDGLKNVISIVNDLRPGQVFKTGQRVSKKQTAVEVVQTDVQTPVQTPNLDSFSVTERAIIWILLNTDMKLSYDDLAAMLGKEKSTVRGQINGIKQKGENLISESVEKNGKKRVFISEKIKEKMLKKPKVRVRKSKKSKENEEN